MNGLSNIYMRPTLRAYIKANEIKIREIKIRSYLIWTYRKQND